MKLKWLMLGSTLMMAAAVVWPAHADSYLSQIGGRGGAQYRERCPQGQVLNGFELRAGDDIDAIRAVCVTPSNPTAVSAPPLTNGFGGGWHGGGGGGLQRLLCPPETPVVTGVEVLYDGIDTISVDQIDIYCSRVSMAQSRSPFPSNQFHAPVQGCDLGMFGLGTCLGDLGSDYGHTKQFCPTGQIGTGVHGHSGALVDAMGLICGPAPIFRPPAPAMGHTGKPEPTPLQKALRNAKVVPRSRVTAAAQAVQLKPNMSQRAATANQVSPASRARSAATARALNPQPLPPGHVIKDANDKAIIIVGGKPRPASKSRTELMKAGPRVSPSTLKLVPKPALAPKAKAKPVIRKPSGH